MRCEAAATNFCATPSRSFDRAAAARLDVGLEAAGHRTDPSIGGGSTAMKNASLTLLPTPNTALTTASGERSSSPVRSSQWLERQPDDAAVRLERLRSADPCRPTPPRSRPPDDCASASSTVLDRLGRAIQRRRVLQHRRSRRRSPDPLCGASELGTVRNRPTMASEHHAEHARCERAALHHEAHALLVAARHAREPVVEALQDAVMDDVRRAAAAARTAPASASARRSRKSRRTRRS